MVAISIVGTKAKTFRPIMCLCVGCSAGQALITDPGTVPVTAAITNDMVKAALDSIQCADYILSVFVTVDSR